jgi:hypothetical protein
MRFIVFFAAGYGNQIPHWMPGRLMAMMVMFFGTPYLAIPLGIIDHEYGKVRYLLVCDDYSEIRWVVVCLQAWMDFIAVQREKERLAKEAGFEHKFKISKEHHALAATNSVSNNTCTILRQAEFSNDSNSPFRSLNQR